MEITVVTQGVGRKELQVTEGSAWADIVEDFGLDTSLEYRLRGEKVDNFFVPVEFDTLVATKNVKGGI